MSISKKLVSEIARGLIFDPKEPGPMKVIAQSDNSNYLEHRIVEELSRAQAARIADDFEQYREHIKMSGRLLILILASEKL